HGEIAELHARQPFTGTPPGSTQPKHSTNSVKRFARSPISVGASEVEDAPLRYATLLPSRKARAIDALIAKLTFSGTTTPPRGRGRGERRRPQHGQIVPRILHDHRGLGRLTARPAHGDAPAARDDMLVGQHHAVGGDEKAGAAAEPLARRAAGTSGALAPADA